VNWFFLFFFFLSGYCMVLYELVWLRVSMAQFGVTTAMVSIVLSVFMAGLGLGSGASGRWLRQGGDAGLPFPALRLYALIELLIGVSGIVVPYELGWGRGILLQPYLSERWSLIVRSLPWLIFGLRGLRPSSGSTRVADYALVPLAGLLIFSIN